jgi:hypothetical protein
MMQNLISLGLALVLATQVSAQSLPDTDNWQPRSVTIATAQVPEQPDLKGGHLQGVQQQDGKVYISGSSERIAYLAILSQNEKGMQFLGIKRLGEKPLSHAGGFQLAGNWLAIGIEDPVGRNESQVLLIDVSTSKTLNAPPVHVLNRRGQAGRSTAGAVALLRRKDHFLLAVGSWNSTVIDFYTSKGLDPYAPDFEFTKWTSWDSREAQRRSWSDRDFGSYQSIQLTEDSTGIRLIGLCRDGKTDRADVFLLHPQADPYTLVQKVGAAQFTCQDGLSFRYGAGLTWVDGRPRILVVNYDLSPTVQVQTLGLTAD